MFFKNLFCRRNSLHLTHLHGKILDPSVLLEDFCGIGSHFVLCFGGCYYLLGVGVGPQSWRV